MISVGGAATGAIKLSPAVLAFPAGICVAGAELASHCLVCNTLPYVAQLELFLAYELVAGIQIAPRCDCHVLCAGAASGYALIYAGAARKVQHVMIEGYGPSLFFAAQHILCKYLVLLLYYLKVVGGQSSRIVRRADHGLHA